MTTPHQLRHVIENADEFAKVWLMGPKLIRLSGWCERSAREAVRPNPSPLCDEDAKAVIWLTATTTGAPGVQRLIDLDPETFDDYQPNPAALLLDGTGSLAHIAIERWCGATAAEREEAFALCYPGAYAREEKSAAILNDAALFRAPRMAMAFGDLAKPRGG